MTYRVDFSNFQAVRQGGKVIHRRRLNRRPAQLLSFPIRPHQTQYVIEFALQLRSLQRATWTNSLINGGRRRRAGEVTVTRARITASASDDDDDDEEETKLRKGK